MTSSGGGPARVDILGVRISAIDLDIAVERIAAWINKGQRTYVCVTGVHGVMEAQRAPDLIGIHNQSGMTTPDGMPMVWAGHFAGAKWMKRVYGPDLMLAVLAQAEQNGWSSYFYGGAQGTPELLVRRLSERLPGLRVAGTYSPPFRELTNAEEARVIDMINQAQPHLVWVGLSTPKQERWIARHRALLRAPVILGVGAAFDFHAGLVRQAPPWIQRSGLEWLYRLWREPRRLWRRYLRNNPTFLISILRRPPRLVPDVGD